MVIRNLTITLLFVFIAIGTIGGCGGGVGGGGGGGGGSDSNTFLPVRINASWTGGAKGPPGNDSFAQTPPSWTGLLCPANTIVLDNHSETAGHLTVHNFCTSPVTLWICTTKGGLQQPPGGITAQCATDPFDTPTLTRVTLTADTGGTNFGVFFPSTQILFINIFYCSSDTQLIGPPLRCG